MGDMVEKRMIKAISMVGSLWYTAWVNAGQPSLENFGEKLNQKQLEDENKELEETINGKSIKGREHDN